MTNNNNNSVVKQVFANRLFLGDAQEAQNMIVSMANGFITDLQPFEPNTPIPASAVHAEMVAPGFIDIQINGARDRQFNDLPDVETVRAIASGARAGGTAYVLPTHTTAPGENYLVAMKAVEEAVQAGEPGILGVHLEGPFLSPEKPGIHDPANMRPITPRDIGHIRAFSGGKVLLTLAPECQPENAVAEAVDAGAIIFAGHSDATSDDMAIAVSEGLSGATHLFNAMSQLTVREPGVVGTILSSSDLFCGIIADGHHVAWPNIQLAARIMPERLCLVTDAMRTLEGTQDEFVLHGKDIRLRNAKLTDETGRLAGAHVSMDTCVRNMIKYAGVTPALAVSMASTNPARALGLGRELGQIAPGYRASLTLLNASYEAQGVVLDGAGYF